MTGTEEREVLLDLIHDSMAAEETPEEKKEREEKEHKEKDRKRKKRKGGIPAGGGHCTAPDDPTTRKEREPAETEEQDESLRDFYRSEADMWVIFAKPGDLM